MLCPPEFIKELCVLDVSKLTEKFNNGLNEHSWKMWVRSAFSDDMETYERTETHLFFRNKIKRQRKIHISRHS